uniref:UPF0725 protein n=1 Tax=Noccaea caerulescens TaxID=107243 RepID=A0A1J3H757_NOCCA
MSKQEEEEASVPWALKRPRGVGRLLAQTGLHCYNLHRGRNLQFLGVKRSGISGRVTRDIILEAEDPISNSTCSLDTAIWYMNQPDYSATPPKGRMELVVTRCLLDKEVLCSETLHLDDFYRRRMPNWMPEDALTGSDKPQYYEMKESDVEQDKQWLHLYAQLALLSLRFYPEHEKAEPVELTKIVVQTKEDVESKNKARAKNAIFYLSFKCTGGQDYKAIVRRTTRQWPETMSLEVQSFK